MATPRTVRDVMTPMPFSVARHDSVAHAFRLMVDHHIRHLPVMSASRLCGLITDRDVALVQSLPDVDPEKVRCGDAMWERPYLVSPNELLERMTEVMAEEKIDSALVMEGSTVVGVFTVTDALRILSGMLREARIAGGATRR